MKEMSAEKVQEFLNCLDQQTEHQWKLYRSARLGGYEHASNEECEAKRLEQTKSAFLEILNGE